MQKCKNKMDIDKKSAAVKLLYFLIFFKFNVISGPTKNGKVNSSLNV